MSTFDPTSSKTSQERSAESSSSEDLFFERRKFIRRLKELTLLKFDPALWKSLTERDKTELKELAETALVKYYQGLEMRE
jgi:hypothetical protein